MYNYYPYNNRSYYKQSNDSRFGGFFVPLILGGLGGYAIGANNWGNQSNQSPIYYYPYPYTNQYNSYYPNNYYYPY